MSVGWVQFDMEDVVCVVRGYLNVNVELLIGNMKECELGGYNLVWLKWCVLSVDKIL
jgi:hypothetical protein